MRFGRSQSLPPLLRERTWGKLLLPVINAMIDITTTRQVAVYLHPPAIVFLLLFPFSDGSAFLAGLQHESPV